MEKFWLKEPLNLINNYWVIIPNNNMTTKAYQDNETKKQKNYLDLYHATIMKNLLDTVIEELNTFFLVRFQTKKVSSI